jgi:probable rRNA maturation factor
LAFITAASSIPNSEPPDLNDRSNIEIELVQRCDGLPVDHKRVRDCCRRVLEREGVENASLSIAYVNDAEMQEINREYLGHDYPTDVISFLLNDALDSGMRSLTGELVVGLEYGRRMAARHGWRPDDELLLYVVHGLLHLCGYDDLTDEARPIMRMRESEWIREYKLDVAGVGTEEDATRNDDA